MDKTKPQKSVIVYDQPFHDLQEQNWPPNGYIFVSLDSQKRCTPECWAVAIMRLTDHDDLTQRGLFWHKDDAVMFAEALLSEEVR